MLNAAMDTRRHDTSCLWLNHALMEYLAQLVRSRLLRVIDDEHVNWSRFFV
jgi:hypothetical protein